MDLECPYCEQELEINHDDCFGYQEGVKHQMECPHCEKKFVFKTSISFYYEPEKADCLNGINHDWQITRTSPKEFSQMCCSMCDEKRELTQEERLRFNIGSKEEFWESLNSGSAKLSRNN
ncbi:MAG TPA: hypothetical protein VL443_30075 [Cyclobacteriaceae bacterium]|jgi:hypothetical protein|nr:hypothetical protein [Cyclobacteriaceae bacterium]